jgi:hypothetical protein
MIPQLPVYSTPQCISRRQEGPDLELLEIIGCFDFKFTEGHQASCMICKVRTLKLPIRTSPFLEDMMIYTKKVYNDLNFNIAVGI